MSAAPRAAIGASNRPNSLIVIHGVGDQKVEETIRDLSRGIGRAIQQTTGLSGIRVCQRGEWQCGVPHSDDSMRVTEYEVAHTRGGASVVHRLYEFHWADLSRLSDRWYDQVRGSVQFLTGLPRLGFRALNAPEPATWPRACSSIARLSFVACWSCIVARLSVALGYIAIGFVPFVAVTRATTIRVLLWFDLITSISALAFLLFLLVRTVTCSIQRGRAIALREAGTACAALTLAGLFSQMLPFSIRGTIELTETLHKSGWSGLQQLVSASVTGGSQRTEAVLPERFYSINSVTGFISYCSMAGLLGWVVILLVLYGFARWPGRGSTTEWMNRCMAWTCFALAGLSVLWLGLLSSFWAIDVGTHVQTGSRFFDLLIVPERDPIIDVIVNGFVALCWVVAMPLYATAFLFVTFESIRSALIPASDLVLDVVNYLPTIPGIDRRGFYCRLYGGRWRVASRGSLDARLARRLRALVAHVHGLDGGPIAIVAHSLGTMIGLAALHGWDRHLGETNVAGLEGNVPVPPPSDLEIELVTMGSPLVAMATAYPQDYDPSATGGMWRLPCVRTWRNLFQSADYVGREIAQRYEGKHGLQTVDNHDLGAGGHTGYFSHDHVAESLVRDILG